MTSLLDRRLVVASLPGAVRKLDPRVMAKAPVMFVVEIGAVFATVRRRPRRPACSPGRSWCGCGSPCSSPTWRSRWPRAAARPRRPRCAGPAPRPRPTARRRGLRRPHRGGRRLRPAPGRPRGRRAGEVVPGDGDVVEGVASVDESAITGESAPVIRESGGDRSSVTGGTRVLSDRIVCGVTAKPVRASSTG